MILLDTRISICLVHRDERLPARLMSFIERQEHSAIGVSAISCWEVAKLVERGRQSNVSCFKEQRPLSHP